MKSRAGDEYLLSKGYRRPRLVVDRRKSPSAAQRKRGYVVFYFNATIHAVPQVDVPPFRHRFRWGAAVLSQLLTKGRLMSLFAVLIPAAQGR